MKMSLAAAALALLSLGAAACQTIDYPIQNTNRPND